MNACHLYSVTSLISTPYTALATVRELTSDIVHGILGAAVLLIVALTHEAVNLKLCASRHNIDVLKLKMSSLILTKQGAGSRVL